ncbi:MAG: glycosyltransferase, partial [Dehalococcoidia bacterium]|nr:glycosyltransferase [Dehalococcoidia bacterium]
MTVLNEAASLPTVLQALEQQTRLPDEVVVVDGGSTDGTLAMLHGYTGPLTLHVLQLPGANISQGRNAAIEAAAGSAIAITDAGVRLEPAWLAAL